MLGKLRMHENEALSQFGNMLELSKSLKLEGIMDDATTSIVTPTDLLMHFKVALKKNHDPISLQCDFSGTF